MLLWLQGIVYYGSNTVTIQFLYHYIQYNWIYYELLWL